MKLGVSFYYVGDTKKGTEIYRHFLGVKPTYADGHWAQFHLEGGDLALHHQSNLAETAENHPVRGGAIVSFTVPDIQEALVRARESGFRQVGSIDVQPFGSLANVRDPWGNHISLLQPGH